MTPHPKSSASPTRALLVAGAASAAYLLVSFTGCSSTSAGSSRTGGETSGGGGSGQGSGTATGGNPSGTTTGGNPTTGGTATGGTTTTGGASTGGVGAGGSTGAGGAGAGGAGTGGGNVSGCTTGVVYPAGNRCGGVAQPTVAAGGQLLIDDLEMAPGDTATCHNIRAVDGRVGSWNSGMDPVSPMGVVKHSFDSIAGTGAPAVLGSRAIHIVGSGLNSWGGYLAVPFAACYNASQYAGLSFWFKGDPAQAPWVKLSIVTPPTAEAAEGGICVQGVGIGNECYDHFSVNLFKVSNVWTRYAITWQQLAQFGWGQKVPVTYRPETQIIGINFAPDWGSDAANKVFNKKFEFWVDNLSFDIAGPFTDTGLRQIVTQAQFESAYTGRTGFFSDAYAQLVAALDDPRFSRVGREGLDVDRKREIAALMAHIWQETGGLTAVSELSPPSDYCRLNDPLYPCVAGQTYIGRGPLQLSWNYNYGQAGEYLGVPTLLSNPGQVATNASLSWRGSMFFWMAWRDKDTNALLVGPHYRFLHEGFGASIRAVNGALECPPTGTAGGLAAAEHRKQLYAQYCAMLGVTPDAALACPAM